MSELTKVLFVLEDDAPTATETLWARDLGSQLFELDNTPFFARGCALGDVVRCVVAEDSFPQFVEVVKPSGYRTIRVFVPKGPERQEHKASILNLLAALGCKYEVKSEEGGLIAVSVPPTADIDAVVAYLESLIRDGTAQWESANFAVFL